MGLAALALGAAGIGVGPWFVRVSEVGPFSTAAYRLIFAAPLFFLWNLRERSRNPAASQPSGARDFLWMALAGFFFAGDMALWNWSLHLTTVANSTLITNLTPLAVMVAARVLFGERITPHYLVGMPVALGGAVLLVRYTGDAQAGHLKGDLVSVGALFFYTGYLLTLRRLRLRFGAASTLWWSGLFSAAALVGVALATGDSLVPHSPHGWALLLGLAVISHVGGQGLIAYGFGHVPAAIGSVMLLIQPLVATILAWGVLHEPLGPMQCVGAVAVLAGIAIACRGR